MNEYKGRAINSGTIIGKAYLLGNGEITVEKEDIADCDEQIKRLKESVANTIKKLEKSKEKVKMSHGNEGADILNTHILLLEDDSNDSLIQNAVDYINQNKVNAEFAMEKTGNLMAEEFEKGTSDYLRARSEDIIHLKKQIIGDLMNITDDSNVTKPSIIVADEVSPETLTSIDKTLLLGIVTRKGSVLSHTAILAKNMNIPYLTGVMYEDGSIENDTEIAIDGKNEKVYVSPDEDMLNVLNEQMRTEKEKAASNKANAMECIEKSPIKLYANIGRPKDITGETEKFAMGIGLFRSEFLYMDRDELPSEEEQYDRYVRVLDSMGGKPVIIRTIDIGADKEARCVELPKEDNPALGTRGIRIGFSNPLLFETQLRALLRASYNRNLKVMFPMITAKWEVEKAIDKIHEVAEMLENEKKEYAIPSIGIMIETPAAVLTLDSIAPLIDFVSIGTNDLTQYTIALDRCADHLSAYYDSHHEAVLKLIEMTAVTAHKHGIEVGICGELGADVSLAEFYVKIGIDELSMATPKIIDMAAALSEIDITKVKAQAASPKSTVMEDIAAPVDGYVIPMEDIPDEAFAGGLMGKCVGIYPDTGVITAPFDGEITMVAKTKHAFSIKNSSGLELLIHVGIDTVELNSRGFHNTLKEGMNVAKNQELMTFDIDKIKEAGYSPIVVVVKMEKQI